MKTTQRACGTTSLSPTTASSVSSAFFHPYSTTVLNLVISVGYGIPLLGVSIMLIGSVGSFVWNMFAFCNPNVPLAARFIPLPDSEILTELGLLQDKLIRICLILFMFLAIVVTVVSLVMLMTVLVDESKIPAWRVYANNIRSRAPWSNTDFVYPPPRMSIIYYQLVRY